MPRNSSGTMTLPAGNPVTTATTISTVWANVTLGDIATEMTDSASRSGKGGFTAPIRAVDGTVAAPAVSFTSEPGTGTYRAAASDYRIALAGVDAVQVTSTFVALPGAAPAIRASAANAPLNLQGNRNAADANADIAMTSLVARTAGLLLDVQNQGGGRFQVDYQGLCRLASPASAIQPATIWTAITPNAGWTAGSGLAYWKDASGMVHLKGTLVPAAGASSFSVFTLPVGFRPAASRFFAIIDNTSVSQGSVDTTGVFAINSVVTTGHTYAVDGVTFLAEA